MTLAAAAGADAMGGKTAQIVTFLQRRWSAFSASADELANDLHMGTLYVTWSIASSDKTTTITVVAPYGVPATRIVDAFVAGVQAVNYFVSGMDATVTALVNNQHSIAVVVHT